jgi:HD-GYP domain-containing protein (c-di-GMP phosphodiesterase class II)
VNRMSLQPFEPEAPDELAERCRTIGLPIWRLGEDGSIMRQPSGWGSADAWLRSPALRDMVLGAARGLTPESQPTGVQIAPGCRLLPVALDDVGPTRTLTVALILDNELLGAEHFRGGCAGACAGAGADSVEVARALSALMRFQGTDLDALAAMLRWMHEDVERSSGHESAINHFSAELTHAYEQISLLYKLGRSMNWLDKPHEFLETTCNLLRSLLDFTWVAVKTNVVGACGPNAGGLVIAGELPCRRSAFNSLTTKMLGWTRSDHWRTLLEPGESELGSLANAQVVAEPVMSGGQVAGLLLAGNKVADDPEVTSIEMQLLDAVADYLGAFLHNVALYEEQRAMFMGTVHAMTAAIDAKDRYTRGHSERVALMGAKLAAAVGMGDEQVERIRIAGLVHDVGKIGVPEAVLRKPGRLTDEEFEQIKRHPRIGYDILQDIGPLRDVLPGVLYHHERWDGRGYPEGLAAGEIPLMGRLLAVADAFDAMSSDRSYRPALPREKVLREMIDCAGSQFDPELAPIFVKLDLTEYDVMVARHEAQEAEAA